MSPRSQRATVAGGQQPFERAQAPANTERRDRFALATTLSASAPKDAQSVGSDRPVEAVVTAQLKPDGSRGRLLRRRSWGKHGRGRA